MYSALYQPDPVPAHALACSIYLRSSSIATELHLHVPRATCREAVWSPCGRCVGGVWAKSGIAESIIGGKMANVPEDEKIAATNETLKKVSSAINIMRIVQS